MPGRRNPLFPWSPVVIDALWQSGILQRVLWPDGNTQALNAEGVGGYRAIFILLTAKAALREHRPEVAAELFRVFLDKKVAPAFLSLEAKERKRWLNHLRLQPLYTRRGRPRDVVVAVRVCAVDCLAELCVVRLRDAIKVWNETFPQYPYTCTDDGDTEPAEAQFRVERRRVRSYLIPPKRKRRRGRPRKYFLERRRHRAHGTDPSL
jgi:hypothetical protein